MIDLKDVPFRFYHIQSIHVIEAMKEVQNPGNLTRHSIDHQNHFHLGSVRSVRKIDSFAKCQFVYVNDGIFWVESPRIH